MPNGKTAAKRAAASGQKATKATNMDMDRDLRKRLKLYVAANDLTMREVMEAALDEYLKKRGA